MCGLHNDKLGICRLFCSVFSCRTRNVFPPCSTNTTSATVALELASVDNAILLLEVPFNIIALQGTPTISIPYFTIVFPLCFWTFLPASTTRLRKTLMFKLKNPQAIYIIRNAFNFLNTNIFPLLWTHFLLPFHPNLLFIWDPPIVQDMICAKPYSKFMYLLRIDTQIGLLQLHEYIQMLNLLNLEPEWLKRPGAVTLPLKWFYLFVELFGHILLSVITFSRGTVIFS